MKKLHVSLHPDMYRFINMNYPKTLRTIRPV